MAVGARIVLGPQGKALAPVAVEPAAIPVVPTGRKHQASEDPLSRLAPIRRCFKVAVFDARELMEWPLSPQDSAKQRANGTGGQQRKRSSVAHQGLEARRSCFHDHTRAGARSSPESE